MASLLENLLPPPAPYRRQSARMRKLTCSKCSFSCRTTSKHIAAADGLICPIPTCDGDLELAS